MTAQVIQFAPRPASSKASSDADQHRQRMDYAKSMKRDGDRWDHWRIAGGRTDVLKVYREFISACRMAPRYGMKPWVEYDADDEWRAIAAWREAVVQQLLTPAPTQEDLNWKERWCTQQKLTYLPVSPEKVASAIAADEAYLARFRKKGRQNGE
jgi:hypothetical protein